MEVCILLALVLIFFAYRSGDWILIGYSAIILLVGLIFPLIFYPIAYVWFGLSKVLGFISSQILLTLLFYILLTPVGLYRRLIGKDSLMLYQFKKGPESVLKRRKETNKRNHFKNPF